jgi:hypothetical protein
VYVRRVARLQDGGESSRIFGAAVSAARERFGRWDCTQLCHAGVGPALLFAQGLAAELGTDRGIAASLMHTYLHALHAGAGFELRSAPPHPRLGGAGESAGGPGGLRSAVATARGILGTFVLRQHTLLRALLDFVLRFSAEAEAAQMAEQVLQCCGKEAAAGSGADTADAAQPRCINIGGELKCRDAALGVVSEWLAKRCTLLHSGRAREQTDSCTRELVDLCVCKMVGAWERLPHTARARLLKVCSTFLAKGYTAMRQLREMRDGGPRTSSVQRLSLSVQSAVGVLDALSTAHRDKSTLHSAEYASLLFRKETFELELSCARGGLPDAVKQACSSAEWAALQSALSAVDRLALRDPPACVETDGVTEPARPASAAKRRSCNRLRSRNPFVDAALVEEDGGDDFADLEGFIVCKRGRTY